MATTSMVRFSFSSTIACIRVIDVDMKRIMKAMFCRRSAGRFGN